MLFNTEIKFDSPSAIPEYSEDSAVVGDVLAGLINCMLDLIMVQNGASNL